MRFLGAVVLRMFEAMSSIFFFLWAYKIGLFDIHDIITISPEGDAIGFVVCATLATFVSIGLNETVQENRQRREKLR